MIARITARIRDLFSRGTRDAAPSSPLPTSADGKPQGQSLSASTAEAPVASPEVAPPATGTGDKAAGGGKRTFE
ncbi:MAG: hypothetical protein ACTHQE_04850 [Thermomicrobiales bacterium]